MSYRLVRINALYNEYLVSYYGKFPEIINKSYWEQYNHLLSNALESWSFHKRFKELGVDVEIIFSNVNFIQEVWKKENDINNVGKELVFEQIKKLKPDVVFIDDMSLCDKSWINRLRKEVFSVKLVLGFICAPFNQRIEENISAFDILFTCTPGFKEDFEKKGINTKLLYHSFESSINEIILKENNQIETDFLFTGSLYTGYGYHKTRIEYIEALLSAGIDIKVFGNIESPHKLRTKQGLYFTLNTLKKLNLDIVANKIPVIKNYSKFGKEPIKAYSKQLKKSIFKPVFGLEMYKLLAKAKMCFNIHGGIAMKYAGNVRLFEATGVGSCLVTDWKANLSDLFEIDKEIVTYHSIDECIEKVKWLIEHPIERKAIALAGQKRTLNCHTIENRVNSMNEIILSELKKR